MLFRPPYGRYDDETLKILRRRGMLMILWTVDTSDYSATAKPAEVAARVLAEVEPGGIVLMHDAGGDRAVTARALTLVIRGLRRRGLRLVTVPQLLLRTKVPRRQEYVAPSSAA
jgi:peptidoglycan/xylan/chitin deacetylase (PgdA/CDA1 family)